MVRVERTVGGSVPRILNVSGVKALHRVSDAVPDLRDARMEPLIMDVSYVMVPRGYLDITRRTLVPTLLPRGIDRVLVDVAIVVARNT